MGTEKHPMCTHGLEKIGCINVNVKSPRHNRHVCNQMYAQPSEKQNCLWKTQNKLVTSLDSHDKHVIDGREAAVRSKYECSILSKKHYL